MTVNHPTKTDRDQRGRFLPGNPGGPGNPHAGKVARLRTAMLEAITPEDVNAAIMALAAKAREGDVAACRELLDRAVGKAGEAADILVLVNELTIKLEELRR